MIKYKNTYIKNIYYMIAYAFSSLNLTSLEDIKGEEFDHIHNLFACILSKGIGRQLKRGLYREYHNMNESIPTVKGKINIYSTVQNRIERRQLIHCEHDELTENNILNKIIKTAAIMLIKHGEVDDKYKDVLKQELLFFSNVDELSPKEIKWSSIRFQRNNRSYALLIGICQLMMKGMLLTTEQGNHRLSSLIDGKTMELLYEKFLLEYYRAEHRYLDASPSYVKWALDDDVDTALLPAMQTDVMLTDRKQLSTLIIDAKFYGTITQSQFNNESIRSAHLYQIFAYVKNKQEEYKGSHHVVSGMLLYAGTDNGIQPDATYKMSGNSISVKTLDLNMEFSEIRKQLDNIAYNYFGKTNEDVS